MNNDILKVTKCINQLIVKAAKQQDISNEFRALMLLADEYRGKNRLITQTLDITLENFLNPAEHKAIVKQVEILVRNIEVSDELFKILNTFELSFSGRPYRGITDIIVDGTICIEEDSHPMFDKLEGEHDNLMYLSLNETEWQEAVKAMSEMVSEEVYHSFHYTQVLVQDKVFLFGVNRRANVAIISGLEVLTDSYRVNNRKRLDSTTYKGIVFPHYNGKDRYILEDTIVDREYLLGALGYLGDKGVLLNRVD